ncbi:hypothetical protein OHC51_12940 [Stenotrophomonas indicatrix]|uniref:hypothetical protein n=1 Tax=Stenotrophomonas indicatrix TaxID=2045451 RepID=UPI003009FDD8
MIKIDPHDRIDLTGPWAGFGFQGGHMIAREWRLMMAEARIEAVTRSVPRRKACATGKSSVIYLAEALRIRRERRLGMSGPRSDAEPSNVVYMRRGPKPRRRV